MSGTIADTPPSRPSFTNGQYIGADDLNAAVNYARDETRRLSLSGRTWGIAGGLALVEIPDATGAIQMWIEPGMAWDGYGRPIVLASPVPVTADLFAGLAGGPQVVWLYYRSVGTLQIEPGFQTCGAGDPATRMTETFGISAGNPTVQQRTGGVIINGVTIADPRQMLVAVDQNSDVVLDASAPYQAFPDDTVPWLVPIGVADYVIGTPGSFKQRTGTMLSLNRTVRRYVNTVAESVLAADGVLRLRDRQSDGIAANSPAIDNAESAAAIQSTDIEVDPNNATRMIGDELVWVEGDMRVIGDARLWGTRLELRDNMGVVAGGAPEFIQRGTTANPRGGQDLNVVFGATSGTPAHDRVVFGTVDAQGTVYPKAVLRTDAKAALGTDAIGHYDAAANHLVIAGTADVGLSIASDAANTGNIFFATNEATPNKKAGYITYDQQKQQMMLGVASSDAMMLTSDGQMAIGPVAGTLLANDFCQLAIANPQGKGTRLLLEAASGTHAEIAFADGTAEPRAGTITYRTADKRMSFGTNGVQNVHIDSNGQIGIATISPQAPLEIYDTSSDTAMRIDHESIKGINGSNPGTILVQPDGGRVGIGHHTPASTAHIRNNGASPLLILDTGTVTALAATGNSVSIGWAGPPRTVFDVVGDVAPGAAPTPATHVAIIENTQGAPSNVLAIKAALPDWVSATNFITFLDDSNNYIGSIEGYIDPWSSTSMTFFTGTSADYAEAVKRAPGLAQIGAGRIVGVNNGLVSLDTERADAVFVTSVRPAMVGGAPAREHRGDYEFLAFLGQVSITVEGTCSPGDLIVPSGSADGLGRAISPAAIQEADIPSVIAQAWAASGSGAQSLVNALVGPGVTAAIAAAPVLARQGAALREANAQLQSLTTITTDQAKSIEDLTEAGTAQSNKLQSLTDTAAEQAAWIKTFTETTAAQAAKIETLTERIDTQAAELRQLAEVTARQAEEIRSLTELVLGTPSRG